MRVGDRVRIERDETLYPSKGTWPQFRGKTGTIVEVNPDRKRPHLKEYGVVFGASHILGRRRSGNLAGSAVTWFKAHEMERLAFQHHAERVSPVPAMAGLVSA